jgi:hypothetical protein
MYVWILIVISEQHHSLREHTMGKVKDQYLLNGFIAMDMKVTFEIVALTPIRFALILETLE